MNLVPEDDLPGGLANFQVVPVDDLPGAPSPAPKKTPESRNIGAVLNDTVISIANAAAGGVAAAADFVAPGNRVSKSIDEEFIKMGEERQSDIVKAGREKFQREVAEAEGLGEEALAAGRYVLENPLQAAGQAVGSFAGPGLAIKGARGAAGLAGLGARGTVAAGTAAGVATGAAMGGGDAAGEAYDLVMATPDEILLQNDFVRSEIEKGRSLAEIKEEAATSAARKASVLPAIVGGAAGAIGVERFLAGGKGFSGGLISRAAKTGLAEAIPEGFEEGLATYTGQAAASEYDPRIDPMKGVGASATLGAVLGLGPGVVVGALDNPQSRQRQAAAQQALQQAPDAATAIAAANELAGSVDELTASVDAYLQQQAPLPTLQAQPERMTMPEQRAMVDRNAQLLAQASQAGTAFDRRMALEQAQVALPQPSERTAANFVDLTPMSEREARNRLTVMRDMLAREGQSTIDLAIVPHPRQQGAFAIARQQLPSLELGTSQQPTVTADQAQARIESAALAGTIEQRRQEDQQSRQVVIDRALRNVEERGGVASPAEARIFQEAGLGRPYDRIDESLAPALTPDQQLTQATGIALDQRPREVGGEGQRLANLEQANAESMAEQTERIRVERAQAERQTQEQIAAANQPAQPPAAGDVIQALVVPGRERTAEQNLIIRQAQARYSPEDFSILQRAANAPFQLNTEERMRLRELRNPAPVAAAAPVAATPGLMGTRVAERLGAPTQGRVITSGAKLSTTRQPVPGATGSVRDGDTEHQFTVVESSRLGNPGRMLQQIARIFGKRLVVFDSDTLQADGFVLDDDNRNVYINAKSQVSPLAVFGHELLHLLKRDNPVAYQALEAVVRRNMTEAQMQEFQQYYGEDANVEELAADLMGNRFQEGAFWSEVFAEIEQLNPQEAPGIISRLGAALNRAVDAFLRVVKQGGFKSDEFVNDLNAVKTAVREAVVAYAQQQRQPAIAMDAGLTGGVGVGDNVSETNIGARNARFSDTRAGERVPEAATADGRVTGQDGAGEVPQYGTAREGAVSVVGRHYSPQPRQALSGDFYGRGLKGAERTRLDSSPDPRLRQRVYFYVDQGTGIQPESGVGGYAHEVRLNNIYDPASRIIPPQPDSNAFESAVLNAGFDGYIAPFGNNQAAAVLLGPKHKAVPVRALGQVASSPAPQAAAPTTLKKSLLSRELSAIDSSRIPGAQVRMGNLEIPADQAEAANAELERIGSTARFARTRKPASDIGHKREGATGRYVGAPDWVGNSPQQLTVLRKKLRQLAMEGEPGRYWYENSSRAILELAGGDRAEAEKIVGLIAIYSPNATVPANTSMALRAYYQFKAGLPIEAGLSDGNRKAEELLRQNRVWSGIKTNSFYQNLMVEIDPSKLEEGVATMDMWMALAFDYGMKALDQGPKYKFAERETQRLANELGWTAHQVQAAIWTAMKGRIDPIRGALKDAELKKGIGEMVEKDGKTAYRVKPDRRYDHFRLAHKMGMEYGLKAEDVAASKFDFSDAIRQRTAQMSWEATPGATTGVLPGLLTAPIEQKFEYLEAVSRVLLDNGRDVIAQRIGLPAGRTIVGFSAWQGDIGAGAQTFTGVALEGKADKRDVTAEARQLLNLYSAIKGYVLNQEAVVWHVPAYDGAIKNQNGYEGVFNRALTEQEMATLYQALHDEFGTWEIAPGYTEAGFRALNFAIDNKQFHKGMERVLASLSSDFGGGMVDRFAFRSIGDYISNDWVTAPNGEQYVEQIEAAAAESGGAGRSGLQEWAAGLRARVEDVNRDFSERYGWGPASTEEAQQSGQARLSRTRLDQAQAEYAEVEARYRDTDQWLKAPNGQPTKLTERQWVQVRTPSFKAWFGDWEKYAGMQGGVWNDASGEVSKVVDDNGEPLVVYHGTNKAGFSVFNRPGGSGRGDLGIFTTPNLDMAMTYMTRRGGEVQIENDPLRPRQPSRQEKAPGYYASFLNLRKPLEEYFEGANWDGSRAGQYQVVNEEGDVQYDEQGRGYFNERDEAEALAERVGGEVEEADDLYQSTDDVVREARRTGDGAIIRQVVDSGPGVFNMYAGEPTDVFVAFEPNQLKSATQNTGEFNPEEDDIRYSRRRNIFGQPAPLATWTAPTDTKFDDFIYAMQDKMVDTKRVVEAVKGAIGRIDDKWNPYLQEELYHGRTAKQTKEFLGDELRPLLQEMQARDVAMADFEEYLHNRHAEERNRQIAKVNPNMPDGGSGIDTADARAYLAALSPQQKRNYEALAKRIDAITASTRQLLVDSGLESADTIAAWEGAYSQYVPLNREDLDFSSSFAGMGTGQGYSVRGASSKRATGSKRDVVDILANIAMQRERAIVRAQKNRVATAVYGLATSQPNTDFWLAVNPDAIKDPVALQAELVKMGLNPLDAQNLIEEPKQTFIDPRTGLVSQRINPALRSSPNVLAVRVDGQDRYVFFNANDERSQRMVSALKNLDADQLGRVMGIAAQITRYFASVNTQYNPIFGVINFLRDVQGATLQLSTTPIADRTKEVLANTIPALRGIYADVRAERKGQARPTGTWAALWEEFQREGGQTGYRDQFSRSAERAEALERELKRITEGKAKQFGRAIFDWLSDYNETMENAVRLAAYKAAKDKGLTVQQAASIAKNLTVNFNRKGQVATQAGALYAFFNAAVQGTTRLGQTLTGPAGKKIVGGGLLLGTLQAVMLAAAGFDEDEPPEFVRERNFIIPLADGKYLTVPMPLGYNVIPNTSRVMTEFVLSGFRDPAKRVGQITGAFLEMFNPIGNAGWSVQTIAPTIADPLVALSENRDWTGKPIAKKDMSSTDPTPGYTRAKETASWFSKQLSYYLNLASGGTKYQPGLISPTPDQIDYLIGQLTGGVGREILKAEQTVTSTVTGEELPPYKVPVAGRFYGDSKSSAAESTRFYENITRLNEHENEIQGRRKNRENATEYLRENPEARLVTFANQIERDVQKLRQRRRDLLEKGASKESIKIIETQITNRMKRLNDRVRALREKETAE